jgi:thermostable 8-oxoguanine DNA glycosylase
VIKFIVVCEIEEEELKELFESNEVKFSKKKAKEIQEELNNIDTDIQGVLQEAFEEIVSETIQELFE